MNAFIRPVIFLSFACISLLARAAFGQGPLTPPGPPAPTMQTLDQLSAKADQLSAKANEIDAKAEKRIPVSVAHTPGDAEHEFIIAQPGSYYLTANLSVTKANGISITAAGVTLDLNGFQISRGGGTGGDGILVRAAAHRTTLKNGTITGFAFGVRCSGEVIDGVSESARAGILSQMSVSECSLIGFEMGEGWQLDSCTATANGQVGIRSGRGGSMVRCVAVGNQNAGIIGSLGSSIVNCAARMNGDTGITVFAGSNISHCVATDNAGAGFNVMESSSITDSTASGNVSHGISVSGRSVVRGNVLSRNGYSNPAEAAGIHASSNDSRIEGNNCAENDRGILVTGSGNLIIKNSASGNALNNYQIATDNRYGAIIDLTASGTAAASGNAAGGTLTTTTNPWANFAY